MKPALGSNAKSRWFAQSRWVLPFLLWVFLCGPATRLHASPVKVHRANGITISISGPLAANTWVTVTIEGAPPPGPDGDPPFGVGVRLNGWLVVNPTPVWDPEEQTWSFSWHIPPGQRFATCLVQVTSNGQLTQQSFEVN